MREGTVFTKETEYLPAQDAQAKKERLANGTQVYTTEHHRFGTDSLLLAHFCGVHRNWKVCDLGSGCGIIPLRWHDMGHVGSCVGAEISDAGTLLLEKAVKELELPHIRPVCCDLRNIAGGLLPEQAQVLPRAAFDLVSCNPPYFTGGFVSQKPGRAAARHTVTCQLSDVAAAAAYLLKDGGRFCICNRPERLADAVLAAGEKGLVLKKLRFVKNRPDQTAWLFLAQFRKNGGAGVELLPDLCIKTQNNAPSEELLAIYGKGKDEL